MMLNKYSYPWQALIVGGVLGFWAGIFIMGAIFFALFSVKKNMEKKHLESIVMVYD
jgi:hypothetical protein